MVITPKLRRVVSLILRGKKLSRTHPSMNPTSLAAKRLPNGGPRTRAKGGRAAFVAMRSYGRLP